MSARLRGVGECAVILALAVATGCRHDAPARETLLIAGSSTVKLYLGKLVEGFDQRNPQASVILEGGGSVGALLSLKEGGIDVAALSGMAEEGDAYLSDYQISRDAVAVVVSPSNPVQGLTRELLAQIYEGKVTSWKQAGGPDAPIDVYRSEPGSHTFRSFTELVLGGDDPFPGARTASAAGGMKAAVADDPNAIGCVSMGHLRGMRPLAIDGVPLTRATVLSGRYPLARAFYLAVYAQPSPLAERFLEFALGPDGQRILADEGLLPVRGGS